MPDPVVILPLHDAWAAAASDLAAFDARVATERAALVSKLDAARVALVDAMPEGVPFATTPDHPPVLVRKGSEVAVVAPHFLGAPYPPAGA